MSFSISMTDRSASRDHSTALLTRLTSHLTLRISGLQRRRARRHMTMAVLQLGHPEVLADLQRAMRN